MPCEQKSVSDVLIERKLKSSYFLNDGDNIHRYLKYYVTIDKNISFVSLLKSDNKLIVCIVNVTDFLT